MKMKKFLSVVMAATMSLSAVSAFSTSVSAEWVKTKSGYSYKDDETGKKLKGWQKINGGKYYFDKNGVALTGWKKINGEKYYFNAAKKGKMLTSWVTIGGKKYYFGSDGVMRTGFVKLNGRTYYFGNDGAMRTGKVKINGKIYDFGTTGILKSTTKSTGGIKIDDLMKNLSFGMKKKTVISKMTAEDYLTEGDMIIVETDIDELVGFYIFDADGLLCSYGYLSPDGEYPLSDLEELFETSGWSYFDKAEGGSLYVADDRSAFGVVLASNGTTGAIVYSDDLLEAYLAGDTGVLDHLTY